MRRFSVVLVVAGALFAMACGSGAESGSTGSAEPEPKEAGLVPTLLDRPFTADQIRDEWVEGFQLRIRQWTPQAEVFQEWTVVRADADGVDIQSMTVGEDSQEQGEASVQTSTWVQLRDHASFPADRAIRELVSRETTLGELQGWLYTVTDIPGGTVTVFFFAERLPGAPVFVHVVKDGELVEIFEQVERSRP